MAKKISELKLPFPWKPGGVQQLALVLVSYKVFYLIFVYICSCELFNSFGMYSYNSNFHWPTDHVPDTSDYFKTWDAQYYLYLSERGYGRGSILTVFPPLWPGVIWVLSLISPSRLLGGLLAANILSIGAWLYFHTKVKSVYNKNVADWALLLMICFPGALFFQFPYSESQFLLLSLVFVFGVTESPSLLSLIAGSLLSATRLVGILSVAPAALYALNNRKNVAALMPLVAVSVGFLLYLWFMQATTGNPLLAFDLQAQIMRDRVNAGMVSSNGLWGAATSFGSFHGYSHSTLDRVMFLLYLLTLYPTFKLNKILFAYSLVFGILPVMGTHFLSCTRYLSVVFPMFIVGGHYFSVAERRYLGLLLVVVFLMLQFFLLMRHINFCWAG